jgi:DNA-binding LytR/AlgR family response regulator
MINYVVITENENSLPKEFFKLLNSSGFSIIKTVHPEKISKEKVSGSIPADVVIYHHPAPAEKVMEKIKKAWPNSMLVALSRSKDPAWKAFELGFLDFVVLPAKKERMQSAVWRLRETYLVKMAEFENADEKFFFVREKNSLQKLKISEICFIQALGDYINIFFDGKKVTVHLNLKHVIKRLPQKNFLRVHRSYIVNIHRIEKILENSVYLLEHHIPIGEAYKKELSARLNIIR